MKEAFGDLWYYPADVVVITTNGFVKKNGKAVMGKGCALQAKTAWPSLPAFLGALIKRKGNHVFNFGIWGEAYLLSFPVKHVWWDPADPELIRRSAHELVAMVDESWSAIAGKPYGRFHIVRVVLPRPGCGNGQLEWKDVKPMIKPILDNRFTVITYP